MPNDTPIELARIVFDVVPKVTTNIILFAFVAGVALIIFFVLITSTPDKKYQKIYAFILGAILIIIIIAAIIISSPWWQPHPLNAYMDVNPSVALPLQTFNFQGQSSIAAKQIWDFGDGISFEPNNLTILSNVNHSYNNSGCYLVRLTTEFNDQSSSASKLIRVTDTPPVAPIALVADFDATPSYADPFIINFEDNTNRTIPIIMRMWDFGDGTMWGTITDDDIKISHTYPRKTLHYAVKLYIVDKNGEQKTRTKDIPVSGDCTGYPKYLDYRNIWQTTGSTNNTTNIVSLQIDANKTSSEMWITSAVQGCIQTDNRSCDVIQFNNIALCPYEPEKPTSEWLTANLENKMVLLVNLSPTKDKLNVQQFVGNSIMTEYNLTKRIK